MTIVLMIVAFAVTIGVLVTVHELGHYLVARWCGVKVLTFSIGFGKPLLQWRRGEEVWQIAMLPLGGYVKMLDEREAEVAPVDLPRAFTQQSVYKRMAIVAAGPLTNYLFAIVVFWLLLLGGQEILRSQINYVRPDSPAALAGFQAGEQIIAVNERAVSSWGDLRHIYIDLASGREEAVALVRKPSGDTVRRSIDFSNWDKSKINSRMLDEIGIAPASYHLITNAVSKEGAAVMAGVTTGDLLLRLDGQPISSSEQFTRHIQLRPNQQVQLVVQRGDRVIEMPIIPRAVSDGGKTVGRIGISIGQRADQASLDALRQHQPLNPVQAMGVALERTWDTSALSLKMLGRMLTGKVPTDQLSGPGTLAAYAAKSAEYGLRPFLEFLCLVSISIGLLNLLPIPVLDGGHLLYYSAELLRGKPLPERVMELGLRFGVGVLVVLMAFALYNDHAFLSRYLG